MEQKQHGYPGRPADFVADSSRGRPKPSSASSAGSPKHKRRRRMVTIHVEPSVPLSPLRWRSHDDESAGQAHRGDRGDDGDNPWLGLSVSYGQSRPRLPP